MYIMHSAGLMKGNQIFSSVFFRGLNIHTFSYIENIFCTFYVHELTTDDTL